MFQFNILYVLLCVFVFLSSARIDDIFYVTQIPHVEIFRVIIKYEEKGWIRIPIDDFVHISLV